MAFKSQIKSAQHLSVKVKTDPNKLAKGVLESINIDGYGLTMQENLCLEQMTINLNEIAVSPFKALMGNVQLTQPSYGDACIVLNENDIETALNIENLNQQLNQYEVLLDDQPVTARFSRVDCRILDDGRVAVKAKLKILAKNKNSVESICLIFRPTVCTQGNGILLNEVECTQGEELSPILTNALMEKAKQIFNLDNLLIDGISLDVNHLNVEEGKLNLSAIAGLTRLPVR
jgi:hypothetical protein